MGKPLLWVRAVSNLVVARTAIALMNFSLFLVRAFGDIAEWFTDRGRVFAEEWDK